MASKEFLNALNNATDEEFFDLLDSYFNNGLIYREKIQQLGQSKDVDGLISILDDCCLYEIYWDYLNQFRDEDIDSFTLEYTVEGVFWELQQIGIFAKTTENKPLIEAIVKALNTIIDNDNLSILYRSNAVDALQEIRVEGSRTY